MATVKFTYALQRFFPDLSETVVASSSLPEVMQAIEKAYPGITSYILDERGELRQHVNIFIDGTQITDRKTLSDVFREDSEIYIMQALSGG